MTIKYKDSKRIVATSKTHTIHSFTSTGNTNFVVTGSGDVEYLVVAGGGGGGNAGGNYGGGGGGAGAGGYKTNVGASGLGVTAQTYTITVGAGGNNGGNGNNSSIVPASGTSIISTGGGNGGTGSGGNAGDGGSGGGGSGTGNTDQGTGISGQGFDGALGGQGGYSASGGGGSSAVGIRTAVIGGDADGGAGGAGTANSITGTAITYAGGGGGGGYNTNGGGAGGSGGGGNGGIASSSTAPVAGSANLGGGGGGALSKSPASDGAAGGSGIVIIRYAIDSGITATGGTITTIDTTKPTDVQDNSILVEKDTAKRYWFDSGVEPTGTSGTGGDWAETSFNNSTIANNMSASGNVVTRTTGTGWNAYIRSNESISPSTGGGEIYFTQSTNNNCSVGLEKSPFNDAPTAVYTGKDYSFHTTTASNNIYEHTSDYAGSDWANATNEFRITMDSAGLVKYYFRSGNSGSWTLDRTSTVTASGDYYMTVSNSNSTPDITCYIKGTPATWTLGGFQPTDILV